MKEFKGTKGEWRTYGYPSLDEDGGYNGGFSIKSTEKKENGHSKTITEVPAYEFWGQTLETAEANAKLIAAAPDLLEALQEICDVISQEGVTNINWVNHRASEAITKALGE